MMSGDDRSKQRRCYLLAALLCCAALFLFHSASDMDQEAEQLRQESRMLSQWKAPKGEEEQLRFLRELLSGDARGLTGAFEAAGIHVEQTSEDFEKTDQGTLRTLHIAGRGSFQQILSSFDIISTKKSWMAIDIREIRRDRDGLYFIADIRSFRHRGAYEETKSGSDRPYGDREEPGGKNTV